MISIRKVSGFSLFAIAMILLCGSSVFAGDGQYSNKLTKQIAKAHNNGVEFQPIQLFTGLQNSSYDYLTSGKILQPQYNAINKLYLEHPRAISMKFVTADGKGYEIEMMQAHPTSLSPNFGYIDEAGRHKAAFDRGVHYQGAVKGMFKSLAALSVFANGEVMMLFANEDGNFVVGKLEDKSGNYILYNDRNFTVLPDMPCGTKDDGPAIDDRSGAKGTAVIECRKVQLYWEVDYQMYQNKGNLSNTQNYCLGLFNQMQTMYNNEQIAIELSAMFIWTSSDKYANSTSSAALTNFRDYWQRQSSSYGADYAMLIARDPGGKGGISYLNVLCSNSSFGYADINGNYNVVPTYSWDVMVVTHEAGHAFGSRHTHWCGWNTGSGGACGAIDNCYNLENGGGCSSCTYTYNKNNTSWKGSVMSYCHLVGGKGIDLANGFRPQTGDFIRGNIANNKGCLKDVISASLTANTICNNDGVVTLSYNANNFGTTPYVYTWSNNAGSKDLSGLSIGGNYEVTITDSNKCSTKVDIDVRKHANPGNGQTVQYPLPLCCKDTTFNFTLNAALPTDVHACQTVGWIRSAAPITTYAAAQTAHAAAQAGDIMASTNANAINNTTAATLTITAPNPCVKTEYYYTPFITRKARAANTIATGITNSQNITQSGETLGAAHLLPDQSPQHQPCSANDTPTTKTLSVTVSGYTGRTNGLTIRVVDAEGEEIYKKVDHAGNGTYSIPLNDVDDPLQEMTIFVFDYNCSSSGSCTGSTMTVTANRSISFANVPALSFDESCSIGTSVLLSFAPDSCYKLSVADLTANEANNIKLYPNPAGGNVTLDFDAAGNGVAEIAITDMLGKKQQEMITNYYTGNNKVQLSTNGLSSGMYFVSLNTGTGKLYQLKLVVR